MKIGNVSIWGYGNYSSDNYGKNALVVALNNVRVFFSYQTPIAYETSQEGLVVRENDWGPTTGKHMDWIDGGNKDRRISGPEFENRLGVLIGKLD